MDIAQLKQKIFKRLLGKESPKSYTTSLPEKEQKDYDYMYVHGSTDEHEDVWFLSWQVPGDTIEYMWWPKEAQAVTGTEAVCKYSDIKWDTLTVKQRYRTWDMRYSSAEEAFWHDMFHLPAIKWWVQKIRDQFIEPIKPDRRIELLKMILQLHSNQQKIIVQDLLIKLHGSALRLSGDYYKHQKDLEFQLASLRSSGDLEPQPEEGGLEQFLAESEVVPAPKAVETVASFNENTRKHRDMVKMSRRQLWLGWAMFALAAVTLFVELSKLGGTQ